ncbi:MAG: thrombospondin type 3 repeat-containing protein, partial [Patescibacteria group bacterium]
PGTTQNRSGKGVSMKASGELMLLNNAIFARVNEFPTMFSESVPAAVRGKWIRITMEDLENYGSYDPGSTMQLFGAMDRGYLTRSQEASRKLYGIALEEGVIVVDYSVPDVTALGAEHYRYGVKINADSLPGFYRRAWPEFVALTKQAAEGSGQQFSMLDAEPSPDLIKTLESAEFKQFIAFLNTSSAMELMVDKQTGYMDKVSFSLRFAPGFDSVKPVTKQISITISSIYSNINQPVTLSEPTEFMNYEEAMQAMTGMSIDEFKFSMQLSNIDKIRSALAQYSSHTGAYPASLADLLKKRGEVPYSPDPNDQLAALMGQPSSVFANMPFAARIPKDVYSHQELAYAVDGDSYALKFTALVPKETAILTANQILRVVDGLNTATEAAFSRELSEALLRDLDEDGLPDIVELYYASSDAIPDTDGDGFADGQEVQNGYNPAGPGSLDVRSVWTRPLSEPEFSLAPVY